MEFRCGAPGAEPRLLPVGVEEFLRAGGALGQRRRQPCPGLIGPLDSRSRFPEEAVIGRRRQQSARVVGVSPAESATFFFFRALGAPFFMVTIVIKS